MKGGLPGSNYSIPLRSMIWVAFAVGDGAREAWGTIVHFTFDFGPPGKSRYFSKAPNLETNYDLSGAFTFP